MLICQRIFMVLFIALLCDVPLAWSETRYISDQLIVSLREAPQDSAEPITYLKTDTPVEVLEAGEVYSKVTTTDGRTGYVQKHFLIKDTPKTTLIKQLTQENASLKDQIETLEKRYQAVFSDEDEAQAKIRAELEQSREQLIALQKNLAESNEDLAKVSQAYDALRDNAQNVVAITEERNQLKGDHEELTGRINSLEKTKEVLLRKQTTQWFLAGAGVLLLGWFLGKFSKSRRKNSF